MTALPQHCQQCKWTYNSTCRHPVTIATRDWQLQHITTTTKPCIFYERKPQQ